MLALGNGLPVCVSYTLVMSSLILAIAGSISESQCGRRLDMAFEVTQYFFVDVREYLIADRLQTVRNVGEELDRSAVRLDYSAAKRRGRVRFCAAESARHIDVVSPTQ